ncbi:MAG: peptide deformylase [Candidatus Harrisonbacteria bacterium CG10_big_fil_rev_8_21_14_0_10_44_23]|uniref:Peptide deformylase n=1 Tax=Candidatus Harrisonbacteria bacterium CG10_big_fil_rev_8_21_14_0_10_44_23 TaxID=1974585 RepID=A0A2H0UQI8_9BACT|nr:MAG: peptide deformylase [Candidatus Harrisonbacteria bacterium CG10_big_fil_rev_8_21_14_0_10_44_23]
MEERILKKEDKADDKFLHRKMAVFDFEKYSAKEIKVLISKMRKMMVEADGIGLAASQVGLDARVFVARDQDKFYAVFNPKITKTYGDPILLEEGCLSVPGYQGEVKRYEKILIEGQDERGKKLKMKAWGLLAHIFQHETDHLDGVLYVDKAINLTKIDSIK